MVFSGAFPGASPAQKDYAVVIHSGELTYPLLDAAEALKLPVHADDMKVEAGQLVEIRLPRAGGGIDSTHPALKEILRRNRLGQTCRAIVGCPIITADAVAAMRKAHIPLPPVHLVTMMAPDRYRCMEGEHAGMGQMIDAAASVTNVFEGKASDVTPILVEVLAETGAAPRNMARPVARRA